MLIQQKMNIVVIVRTLNEQSNIENFCRGYAWADKIIVVDGGSTDDTLKIADNFTNVETQYFNQKIFISHDGSPTNVFMNPESAHQNHAIRLAETARADWIIADDCDGRPNKLLQERARDFLETCGFEELMAPRLYIWGKDKYFPMLNRIGQSMWAWRPYFIEMSCDESDPQQISWQYKYRNAGGVKGAVGFPYALLHYGWPDEVSVQRKMERYAMWRKPQQHPLKACGPLEALPAWAE